MDRFESIGCCARHNNFVDRPHNDISVSLPTTAKTTQIVSATGQMNISM